MGRYIATRQRDKGSNNRECLLIAGWRVAMCARAKFNAPPPLKDGWLCFLPNNNAAFRRIDPLRIASYSHFCSPAQNAAPKVEARQQKLNKTAFVSL